MPLVVYVTGARRVGKSVFAKRLVDALGFKYSCSGCHLPRVREGVGISADQCWDDVDRTVNVVIEAYPDAGRAHAPFEDLQPAKLNMEPPDGFDLSACAIALILPYPEAIPHARSVFACFDQATVFYNSPLRCDLDAFEQWVRDRLASQMEIDS
jgi:hypothetical protein